jgi:hypothetical protein
LVNDKDSDENVMPIYYVLGSNRLSWKRLIWEYKKSLVASEYIDTSTEHGSFQIFEEELYNMGLVKPELIACKANSLLIINVAGFYKYKDSACKGVRCEFLASKDIILLGYYPRCKVTASSIL